MLVDGQDHLLAAIGWCGHLERHGRRRRAAAGASGTARSPARAPLSRPLDDDLAVSPHVQAGKCILERVACSTAAYGAAGRGALHDDVALQPGGSQHDALELHGPSLVQLSSCHLQPPQGFLRPEITNEGWPNS